MSQMDTGVIDTLEQHLSGQHVFETTARLKDN